jgi:hypothetical protein
MGIPHEDLHKLCPHIERKSSDICGIEKYLEQICTKKIKTVDLLYVRGTLCLVLLF